MGEYKMFSTVLLLLLAYLSMECDAIDVKYEEYRGLDKQVPISSEVRSAMIQLNRYCGGGGYSYRPTYYRPTTTGPNLGSLISPVVFGLATGAGLAALGNLIG